MIPSERQIFGAKTAAPKSTIPCHLDLTFLLWLVLLKVTTAIINTTQMLFRRGNQPKLSAALIHQSLNVNK